MYNPFSYLLLTWYDPNRRVLPWKENNDPYNTWLSEIILQQTRVEQGMPYFMRFLAAFPTIADLAAAHTDQVLKLWEGLGYYSRARNLQIAARQIVETHQGKFPETYAEIRALKGVGDYTASAIASFSFGLHHAVVDGNVYRVLSRYFGWDIPIDSAKGKKEFAILAQSLLPVGKEAIYNQAIMDFGALVCTPRNPACSACPLSQGCVALITGNPMKFPVKEKKLKRTVRYFHYLVPLFEGRTILRQREKGDIWAGLFEFPMIETDEPIAVPSSLFLERNWIDNIATAGEVKSYSQDLTHRRIYATFTTVYSNECYNNGIEVSRERMKDYAFPKIIRMFLHDFSILGNI